MSLKEQSGTLLDVVITRQCDGALVGKQSQLKLGCETLCSPRSSVRRTVLLFDDCKSCENAVILTHFGGESNTGPFLIY